MFLFIPVPVTRDCEVLVQAQGMRPENILLLVHEVFEALIHESFRGVHYEYRLPCFDCIKSVGCSGVSAWMHRNDT